MRTDMGAQTTVAVAETTPKSWTPFETETCSRCFGSGTYSWTSSWGSTCFKCGTRPHVPGRGEHLTARGIAASKFWTRLLSRPASEIVAGDVVRIRDLGSARFRRVISVEPGSQRYSNDDGKTWQEAERVVIRCEGHSYSIEPDTMVRVAADAETKQRTLALALRYQAILTKKGEPRKSKAAQAELEELSR